MWRVLAVCVLLLAVTVPAGSDDFPLEYAVVKVGNGCTGVVIGSRLLMTASHCVSRLQSKVPVKFHDGSKADARVVWDSYYLREDRHGLDVAFLVLNKTWDYYVELKPFSEKCPKSAPCVGWTTGFSGGIHYWDEPIKVVGPYFIDDFEWVYIYRGEILPGASGSAVFVGRTIVGLVTQGTTSLQPPFVFGATAQRLSDALQNLVSRGEMKWCKVPNIVNGKRDGTREEVCVR